MPLIGTAYGLGGLGGGGGDGQGVTQGDINTLKHFKYDAARNRLVATREIQATLNSFLLGEQHKMSSGGENIFFTNLSSNINWFPAWSGLRDQSNVLNQGINGVVPPSIRTYADMTQIEVHGTLAAGTVAYADSTLLVNSNSLFRLRLVTSEVVAPVDWLRYRVYLGADTSGIQIFNQIVTGITADIDDVISLWFSHPLETGANTQIYTELTLAKESQDALENPLQVRAGADGAHWSEASLRVFTDVDMQNRKKSINSFLLASAGYAVKDSDGGGLTRLQTENVILDGDVLADGFTHKFVNDTLFGVRVEFKNFDAMNLRDSHDNLTSLGVETEGLFAGVFTVARNSFMDITVYVDGAYGVVGHLTSDNGRKVQSLMEVNNLLANEISGSIVYDDTGIAIWLDGTPIIWGSDQNFDFVSARLIGGAVQDTFLLTNAGNPVGTGWELYTPANKPDNIGIAIAADTFGLTVLEGRNYAVTLDITVNEPGGYDIITSLQAGGITMASESMADWDIHRIHFFVTPSQDMDIALVLTTQVEDITFIPQEVTIEIREIK